jgi:hypothetical protein
VRTCRACASVPQVTNVSLCVQAGRWLAMANKDPCALFEKPFYGKQMFIRCGECDSRFHSNCLHPGVVEGCVSASTVKSTYTCDSCKKLSGDTLMEHSNANSNQEEVLSTEIQCNTSCIGDNASLSVQLEAVRANRVCTIRDGAVFNCYGNKAQQ